LYSGPRTSIIDVVTISIGPILEYFFWIVLCFLPSLCVLCVLYQNIQTGTTDWHYTVHLLLVYLQDHSEAVPNAAAPSLLPSTLPALNPASAAPCARLSALAWETWCSRSGVCEMGIRYLQSIVGSGVSRRAQMIWNLKTTCATSFSSKMHAGDPEDNSSEILCLYCNNEHD
jgi:hypothetical protein